MTNNQIKTVGVIVKPGHAEAWQTACELSEWLEKRGIALIGKPYSQPGKPDKTLCDIEVIESDKFDADLCGEVIPPIAVSDGPRLVLVFSSGDLWGRGFKAKYSFETGQMI